MSKQFASKVLFHYLLTNLGVHFKTILVICTFNESRTPRLRNVWNKRSRSSSALSSLTAIFQTKNVKTLCYTMVDKYQYEIRSESLSDQSFLLCLSSKPPSCLSFCFSRHRRNRCTTRMFTNVVPMAFWVFFKMAAVHVQSEGLV